MNKIITSILLSISVSSLVAQWNAVGNGCNNIIKSLAAHPAQNKLYAGGNFNSPGNYIAIWDGNTWSTTGNGMDEHIDALMHFNGDIIAGGDFSDADGVSVQYFAKYNGSVWSPVTTIYPDSFVLALTNDGTNIYAGGMFKKCGADTNCKRIAKWDGNNWSPLGKGLKASVYAMCTFNGNIVAAGEFKYADTMTVNYVAMWDGVKWNKLGAGFDNYVKSLAVYNNELYAGGVFLNSGSTPTKLIAKWNGTSWEDVGGGLKSNHCSGLKVFKNELYAVGGFSSAGATAVNNIARWDGTTWKDCDLGIKNWYGLCMEEFNNELYVAGYFAFAGEKPVNNIARYSPLTGTFENIYSGGILVYPNPANNILNIHINQELATSGVTTQLFDISGKNVFSEKTTEEITSFDISKLSKGIYLLKLINDSNGEVFYRKITIH